MAHVGDVHLQREVAVRQLVHQHGIVEIARRLAVDRNDGQSAKIAPAFQIRRRDDGGHRLRLFHHLGRKTVRQMVLADDDLDIDAEIARRPRTSITRPTGC